ncbi:hypothetical protein B7R54_18000 [Subtercola boreus]|uniref:Uncharacterized protein n=2 Tax=Subtercola boreus TaxID=120213 RepID=A0A3E0VN63_9MICO|nr:hypothetical protein B7R54_18000 [Subtercola boreus]
MREDVLILAHEEILRLRERQIGRISSIRGRSAGVLGASGIAASLVSALANSGYTLAIICFVLATVYAVKSMTVTGTRVMHPVGVLSSVANANKYDARVSLIGQLRKEYDRAESDLKNIVGHTRTAMKWFLAGTVMLLLVSGITALIPIINARG